MTTQEQAIFAVALLFAVIWTALLWRISRDDSRRRRAFKCSHRWHRIEDYANGRAKARCLACGKVALVTVRRDPGRPA